MVLKSGLAKAGLRTARAWRASLLGQWVIGATGRSGLVRHLMAPEVQSFMKNIRRVDESFFFFFLL